jgi:hypothetical protein
MKSILATLQFTKIKWTILNECICWLVIVLRPAQECFTYITGTSDRFGSQSHIYIIYVYEIENRTDKRPLCLYGDVTITGEGLQNLGLCSALRAFVQGFFYRARPAVTRGLGFPGLIRRAASFNRLLRHARGCGKSILTRILTGPIQLPLTTHKVMWRTYSNPDPYGRRVHMVFMNYRIWYSISRALTKKKKNKN